MTVKTLLGLLATLLFLLPAGALAQDAGAAESRPAKPRTVAAVVGADAASFIDANEAQWVVSNPEALDAYRNQHVKVKYLASGEGHRARILSVKADPSLNRNAAYKTDSAYRR